MKRNFVFVFVLLSISNSYSQNKSVATEINKLFNGNYIFDTVSSNNFYNEYDINGDGKKEIITAVRSKEIIDWGYIDDWGNKIFVLENKNGSLKIIDSSCLYSSTEKNVYMHDDTLIIQNGFSHGCNKLIYSISSATKKFQLRSIVYIYIDNLYNDKHQYIDIQQVYNVSSKTLDYKTALRKYDEDKEIKSKHKIIGLTNIAKPGTALSQMKIDLSDYDKYFIYDGTIYTKMMKY